MASQKGRSNVAKSRFGPKCKLRTHTCWSFPSPQTVQSLGIMLCFLHKQTLLFWRCYKPSSFRRRESGPIISLRKSESLGTGLDVGMKGPQLVTTTNKDETDLLYQHVPLVTWCTCAYAHIEYLIQITCLIDVFIFTFCVFQLDQRISRPWTDANGITPVEPKTHFAYELGGCNTSQNFWIRHDQVVIFLPSDCESFPEGCRKRL